MNAVAPGFVETRMTRSIAERTGAKYEEVKRTAAERTALNRVGRPEEIASAISFLASSPGRRCTSAAVRERTRSAGTRRQALMLSRTIA